MLFSYPAPSSDLRQLRLYRLPSNDALPNTPPSELWTKEAPNRSDFAMADIGLNDLVAVIFGGEEDWTEPTPSEIHIYSVENGAYIRQIDLFNLGHRREEYMVVSRFHIHLIQQWRDSPDQEHCFQQYTCINIADPRQRYTMELGEYLETSCSMHLSCDETAVMFATGLQDFHCMDLRGRKFFSHEKPDGGSASPCGFWVVWREKGSNEAEAGWYKMPYSERDLGWLLPDDAGSAEDGEDV
ncbi:hypothetical protein HK104_000499 [Borealophlyctis nickersoniae]|nr:hypothetical protein HK104_000499 [Borealophlyctis nickersoniae]